jgi:hypothetical protein
MRLLARAPQVGVYVCGRGVFGIECRRAASGMEVVRTFGEPFALRTARDAADHLTGVLSAAGIARADVSMVVRGFGVAHHHLQLPPAADSLIGPIVEREVRRLEPHLTDCVVQWAAMPPLEPASPTTPPQRSVFAIAAPAETVGAFESGLAAAGHRLKHLTALPVAAQRLLDQFDSGDGTIATIVPLPDGAYIGFSLAGGIRLIVEPPLPSDMAHEAAALAEEVDLAAMFVRQQFRGATTDRVVLVGARASLQDLKTSLADRMRVPVKHLEADALAPVGFVALAAVLDGDTALPQSLGGATRQRAVARGLSRLESISIAAVVILALVGFWTIVETARSMTAGRSLAAAQQRLERDAFTLAPARATAEQRRLVRNAMDAVQLASIDRVRLQTALAGIASAARLPVRIDSLHLVRADAGWRAVLTGDVESSTNARAVQALHELYREIPQRVTVDSVRLDRLNYTDADGSRGIGAVRFQLSFAILPAAARP